MDKNLPMQYKSDSHPTIVQPLTRLFYTINVEWLQLGTVHEGQDKQHKNLDV